MAECTVEIVCNSCTHRNICKWTGDFVKLVQMVNETQFKYGTGVDKPIKVECVEWQEKIKIPRTASKQEPNLDYYANTNVLR